MHGILPQIEQYGATLVALTPHLPEHSLAMTERHKLGFDLLSDRGNAYAAELGLRFEVPPELKAVYTGRGIDLPAYNGEPSWTLPIPARIVVGADGVVRDVNADVDYTRRPEPETTLEVLAGLG